MKKLSLVFAMVFATVFAMAQHIDIVNQTGNSNVANVDQIFDGSGTTLPGNEAYVDQIGSRNVADVDQANNGYAGAEHWAKIYSEGNDNYGKIFQENDGGDAIIWQKGSQNYADIFQTGNFNVGAPMDANYNAVAYQEGNVNYTEIDVWGTNATAYAYQKGNSNVIDQDLGSAYGEKVENSDFDAVQIGSRNKAVQMMEGEGWAGGITADDNYGTIRQEGNDNYAIQNMTETIGSPATDNYAKAFQDGDLNWSGQNQAGGGNSSIHSQIGSSNYALTNQN